MEVRITLTLLLLSSINCENCVPLKDCQTLWDLVQNKDSLPNITRADVFGQLRERQCGFDGATPLLNCPETEGMLTL